MDRSDIVVDLESCRSTRNGDSEELSKVENGSNANRDIKDGYDDLTGGSVRVFIDDESLVEKKTSTEKRKSTSAKKPPKPPRPPRVLSLDAADQKLIKEIAELAKIKRARIERKKTLKKMKAANASSVPPSSALNGSFLALLFTVFFFFVLLFQGISYRSSTMSFDDSVKSGRVREKRFIIVQDDSNLSTSTAILADKVEEQASCLTHGSSPKSITS